MITLVCPKCATTFDVDDGFAGGVCRCSACGTIQTVPSKQSATRGGGVMPGGAVSGHAIYERRDAGTASPADAASTARNGAAPRARPRAGSDLEALSEIVTSSGLGGSGMLGQSRARYGTTAQPVKRNTLALGIAIGAGIAVLLAAGALLVFWITDRPGENLSGPLGIDKGGGTTPAARTSAGPSFGSIALDSDGTVVYLVDRGDATRAYTAPLQRAVLTSVASLGEKRKFQVRYWSAGGESPAYPPAPAEATTSAIKKLGPWMADIAGGRATDATESLNAALASNPAELVIITGKAWQLDDSFANEAAVRLRAASGVRVHTVSLGSAGGNDALSRLAARTGGQAIELDAGALEKLGS